MSIFHILPSMQFMAYWNLFDSAFLRVHHQKTYCLYPPTRVPAYPRTRVPAYPRTRVPAYPRTRVPAYPRTRVPAYPRTRLPAYTRTRVPAYPRTRVHAYPPTRVPMEKITNSIGGLPLFNARIRSRRGCREKQFCCPNCELNQGPSPKPSTLFSNLSVVHPIFFSLAIWHDLRQWPQGSSP